MIVVISLIAACDCGGHTLTVVKSGSGGGGVKGGGIDCGSACSVSVDDGAAVALEATPDATSAFSTWTGCDSWNGTTCNLTMNGDRSVTATFSQPASGTTHRLSVQKSGAGAGAVSGGGIDCGASCVANVAHGTAVTLTAAPAVGSAFGAWTGCDTTTGMSCKVTIDADRTVTITFNPVNATIYTLTVVKSGSGAGAVSGNGIDCGSACTASVAQGTAVTLTASAAAGSTPGVWTNCDSASGATCRLTMNGNRTVSVTFDMAPIPAPSGLTVLAESPTAVMLRWTDNSTNETGFLVERESTSIANAWITVTTTASNTISYHHAGLSETWPGYRIRAVNALTQSAPTATAWAPPKLRVVNDLYNQTSSTGNDWDKLNTIVRVRVGPSTTAVQNDTTNRYERLAPYDATFDVTLARQIDPSYTAASTYHDFDVSAEAPSYVVYVQCGWWDYFVPSSDWEKHMSLVLCTNGTCCCYKWATWQVNSHSSGYFVLRLSSGLPHGSWNGTF